MNFSKKIYDRLLTIGGTVATHHDADGLSAGALLTIAIPNFDKIIMPTPFGNVMDEETGELASVILDFGRPIQEEFKGISIDHHPQPETDTYDLIWRPYPTARIVYELLKNKIPEDQHWKCAIGCTGDGQPEKIPLEVLMNNKTLFEEVGKFSFKGNPWSLPVYRMLSSPINAICRVGSPYEGYAIIKDAKTPWDILENPSLRSAQAQVKAEVNKVIKGKDLILKRYKGVYFFKYSSAYSLEGRIGTQLNASTFGQPTFIVVNVRLKKFSIRGDLALVISSFLNAKGIKAGGHAGYAGGSLTAKQTSNDMWSAIQTGLRTIG